ncbi:MAG: alginate export family protein, partial [Candidatus Omnitrophica bacterium]|nr:alginate export family protein [Candidatus Omnitrophota bacterium]
MSVKRMVCAAVALAVLCIAGISYAEPSFKLGFSERARHEYWKDIFDNNDDVLDNRNFFRFKTSAWLDAQISKDFKAFVKFSNENRAYTYWGVNTTGNKDFHYDANEIVFDNLYFDVNNILGAPFDLRIGRQDLLGAYGEGFLIMEGTPQDGSRTFYFNAVKGVWRVNDVNTLDFIYINNPRDDVFLPALNEDKAPQNLNTTDEEAYVLYWKNKGLQNLLLENYYIYKREDDDGGRGLQGEKSRINALGSYAKYSFAPWTLRGQYAYQFGKYGTRDRSAMGGFVYLDRAFEDVQWKPVASLGFSYLSGDKRNSSKVEAWDPLFSRWPWVSEIYVMSMGTETGVLGYWTNVQV